MKKRIFLVTLALFLAILTLFSLVACADVEKTGDWENATHVRDMEFGKGAKTVTVKVTAGDQTLTFTLKTDKDERFVTVKYAGFPYLGIWQEYGADTPFICVEPWCGLPDYEGLSRDILKKNEMFHIRSGEAKSVSYSIIFG